jgi:hypothetical protein
MQAALRAAAKVLPEAGPDGVVGLGVLSRPSPPEEALGPSLKGAAQADTASGALATLPYRKKGPRVFVVAAAIGIAVIGAAVVIAILGRDPAPGAQQEERPKGAAAPSDTAIQPAGGSPSVTPAGSAATPDLSGSAASGPQPTGSARDKKPPATTPKPRSTGDMFDEFN